MTMPKEWGQTYHFSYIFFSLYFSIRNQGLFLSSTCFWICFIARKIEVLCDCLIYASINFCFLFGLFQWILHFRLAMYSLLTWCVFWGWLTGLGSKLMFLFFISILLRSVLYYLLLEFCYWERRLNDLFWFW